MIIYFKSFEPTTKPQAFSVLEDKYDMGLNVEIKNQDDFYYKADIFIGSMYDLWELQTLLNQKLSFEYDEKGDECIVV